MKNKINVTIWNEYRHEKGNPKIAAIYPEGIGVWIVSLRKTTLADNILSYSEKL